MGKKVECEWAREGVEIRMWDRNKANESARHGIGTVDQPATSQRVGLKEISGEMGNGPRLRHVYTYSQWNGNQQNMQTVEIRSQYQRG